MELDDCDDMRDNKSIEAGASGLLKIIFPHKQPSEEEFYKYCVNPALELRQRIRDELCKIDREYLPVTLKSKFPDSFQINHKLPIYYDIDSEGKRVPLPHLISTNPVTIDSEDPLDINRKPKDTSLSIKEGGKGYSYKNLFFPYLKDAKEIKLTDPYIRKEHQLKNFIAFCEVLAPKEGNISVSLITKSEDSYQRNDIEQKFKDLQSNLLFHGIIFNYQFDDNIHDRFIESDNGWRISLGRGLDIFQKPETNYGLGEFDQQKRRCRETEINYRRIR